jgi:hypothetical protein
MVEKFLHVAQGRFGSRAMRGILEGNLIDASQRVSVELAFQIILYIYPCNRLLSQPHCYKMPRLYLPMPMAPC